MGFKPDRRPTGFLKCFDTVGLVIWPVKIVPEITYNVLSGTLASTLLLLLLDTEICLSHRYLFSVNCTCVGDQRNLKIFSTNTFIFEHNLLSHIEEYIVSIVILSASVHNSIAVCDCVVKHEYFYTQV